MDQQSDYLNLHDKIAGIHPSGDLVKELAGLAEKPILQGDALELLLLAEQAMHAHQWQAAAQLFSLMMVRSFGQGYDEAYLVEHANRITLLTTEHETELQSATDLLLYGHRRLIASLRGDGMQQPYLGEWMVSAFSKLLQVPEARVAAMRAMAECIRAIIESPNVTSPRSVQPEYSWPAPSAAGRCRCQHMGFEQGSPSKFRIVIVGSCRHCCLGLWVPALVPHSCRQPP